MSTPPHLPLPQGSQPQGIPYPNAPRPGYGSGPQPGYASAPQQGYGSQPPGSHPYGSGHQHQASQPYGAAPQPAPYPGAPAPQGYVHGQPVPAGPAGRPPKQKKPLTKRWWFWAIIIVVVLAFLGSLGGGGESSDGAAGAEDGQAAEAGFSEAADSGEEASGGEPDAEQAPADEAQAEPAAAGVGDPVEAGDFEITVVSVETGVERVGDEYFYEDASGQFVLVDLTVKNLTDSPSTFWEDSLRLTDPEGREYSTDFEAQFTIAGESDFLTLEEINPGNTASGVLIFDLPEGVTPDALSIEPGFLSEPVRISLS